MFLRRFGTSGKRTLLSLAGINSSVHLARIAGIRVGVHFTWFLLLAVVTWSLATQFYPTRYFGWSGLQYWATGLAAALLLFASVLAHEFAHSLVARWRGIGVDGITLFMLGGVSRLRSEPHTAREEFAIAVAGPATSLLLSGLFFLLWLPFRDWGSPLEGILVYLAVVNLVLGIFNLMPAYPMDGGRIFRSIVWALTGNPSRATVIAAWGGQLFGVLFVAFGIVLVVQGNLGGVLLVLVGVFLVLTAYTGRKIAETSAVITAPVGDVMNKDPNIAAPGVSVYNAVHYMMLPTRRMTLYVCEGNRLLGRFSGTDALELPESLWQTATVGSVMTPMPLLTLSPSDELVDAVNLLSEENDGDLPVVVDGDILVGSMGATDALRHTRAADKRAG